jgi:phage repressor protein C with HTH and peptisase S24 domain
MRLEGKDAPRAWHANGGYGVLVADDSMSPEYNKNDTAYIDPSINPKKDDPCLFTSERPDGTEEGLMAYLERSPDASETVYYVSQTNPPKKFTIKKADWQKCHRMVGKESGRY